MSDRYRKLFFTIAEGIDEASPRDDPSPLHVARAIKDAAFVPQSGVRPTPEADAIAQVLGSIEKGWGDWCGGRVEPTKIADEMHRRFVVARRATMCGVALVSPTKEGE